MRNKVTLNEALKQNSAVDLAWKKYWARPEKDIIKKAFKAQKDLQDNGFYVSGKLQKNARYGKNYVCLSSKEVHQQNAAEKAAFDTITELTHEVQKLQHAVSHLQSQVPKKQPTGRIKTIHDLHRAEIFSDQQYKESVNEWAETKELVI